MSSKYVVVVNGNPEYLALIVGFLRSEGYEVEGIPHHQNAFEQIKETKPDIVVCDISIDTETTGFALLDLLYLDPSTRKIVLIVSSSPTKRVQEIVPSLEAKGIKWLEKPFAIETLLKLLENLE